MRKNKALLVFLSLPLLLTGCGETSLPTTDKEKVSFAFKGVEKTLKNPKASKKSSHTLSRKNRISESEALNLIYSLEAEEMDMDFSEISVNEPPLIQFLYLKSVYDEVGNDFQLNTKYNYTMTGAIYYDFSVSDLENQEHPSNLRQDYVFDLSLVISIDEFNLISCQVCFDMTFKHDSDEHHEIMYADLLLNYDMSKTEANYELSMRALTDCLEYESDEEKYFHAEYDYVKVIDNGIYEWRKFSGVQTDRPIEFNEQYQSFRDYLAEEDFVYRLDNLRWYKDRKLHVARPGQLNNTVEKWQDIAVALVDGFGLNLTDLNYGLFILMPSTQNKKLENVFNNFSRINGKDITYDLVYTGVGKKLYHEGYNINGGGEDTNFTRLVVLNIDRTEEFTFGAVYPHFTLHEAFGYDGAWIDLSGNNNAQHPVLCLEDKVRGYFDISTNDPNLAITWTNYSDGPYEEYEASFQPYNGETFERLCEIANPNWNDRAINFRFKYDQLQAEIFLVIAEKEEKPTEPTEPEKTSEDPTESSEPVTSEPTSVEEIYYYVVGSFNNWEREDSYLMDKYSESYYMSKPLILYKNAELKVSSSNNDYYGTEKGANLVVGETGIYQVALDLTRVRERPVELLFMEPLINEVNYYVTGSFNSWTTQDEQYKMTQLSETTFAYYGLTLYKDTEIKVVSSNDDWYGNIEDRNIQITKSGVYNIVLDLQNAETHADDPVKVTLFEEVDDPEVFYYLVGSFNGWTEYDKQFLMSPLPGDEYSYYFDIDLAEGEKFKVMSSLGMWYGDAQGNDIAIPQTGRYRVYYNTLSHEVVANMYV